MSRDWDLQGFNPTRPYIPEGVTNAVLYTDTGYVVGNSIRYASGGSLLLFKAPNFDPTTNTYGATFAPAVFASMYAANQYYLFDSAPLNYNGAARYYLAAVGATSQAQILQGLGPGYSTPT